MPHFPRRQAFTMVELLVVISIIALLIGILLPSLGAARRTGSCVKHSANLRGIDQSMAIFGNSNNDYLPGFSKNGVILTSGVQAYGNEQTGASFHARLWVLLNGQYIGGDLVTNPQDTLSKWVTGQNCTSSNTSYAGLQIGDAQNAVTTANNEGRADEWKNNANALAIMFSDRLYVVSDTGDTSVQSVWTSTKGDWKGNVVWGDNHAEFLHSQKGFKTRYLKTENSNDNLFVTMSTAVASENAGNSTGNAMMVYY